MALKYKKLFRFVSLCLLCVLFFYYVTNYLQSVYLKEKVKDCIYHVDLVCEQIEVFVQQGKSGVYDYKNLLISLANQFDTQYGIYCQMFDNGLNSLSVRTPLSDDVPFSIFDYDVILDAVRASDIGNLVVHVKHPKAHDLHMYFRWVQTEKAANERYLVIVGISVFALTNTFW